MVVSGALVIGPVAAPAARNGRARASRLDHLDYIVPPLTCDSEQKTQPFDIGNFVGQTLWFGAHNHPDGGGSGTTACMAAAK